MKVIITGTDDAGRSYVHAVEERTGQPTTEALHALLDGPVTGAEGCRMLIALLGAEVAKDAASYDAERLKGLVTT